jgi:hypothetical protein
VDLVGGADVAVVADVQGAPKRPENAGDLIAVFLLVHAFLTRDPLDVLAVLVGAGEEEDIVPRESARAGQGIARDRAIGVTRVGHVVHVVDRRGVEESAWSQQ